MTDEKYLKKLGKRVVQLREKHDFSENQLALKVKVNRSTINRIEHGEVNSTINLLRKIAKAFDISIEDLVKE